MKKILLIMAGFGLMVGGHLSAAPPPNPNNGIPPDQPADFLVTANVNGQCIIKTDPAAVCPFGAYDPAETTEKTCPVVVEVLCTKGTEYWVGLDAGLNPGTWNGTDYRFMLGDNFGDLLAYELRQPDDVALWGDGALGSDPLGDRYHDVGFVPGGGIPPWQPLTVNGHLPVNQWNVSVDTYQDTVTAWVRW